MKRRQIAPMGCAIKEVISNEKLVPSDTISSYYCEALNSDPAAKSTSRH